MKLLELSLRSFGAIAERKLCFAKPVGALHVIYGPNEAGKSTTLRALLAFLYGVDERSDDAKIFGASALRLAALIETTQGARVSLVRRKLRKDSLQTDHGEPVPETVLTELLHGLSDTAFRNMFGLDHQALRDGGEQLRQGHGDLGESLFQASVGGPSVRALLDALDTEANELWKPRAKNASVQLASKEYEEARVRHRQAAKSTDAVKSQQEALERQREQVAKLHEQRRALHVEHGRLERAQHLIDDVHRRQGLLAERARLGEVRLLPDDATRRRAAAEDVSTRARSEVERARSELERLERERAELPIHEALCELSEARISDLRDRVGHARTRARELPELRRELLASEETLLRAASVKTLEELRRILPAPDALDASERALRELASEQAAQLARERAVEGALAQATRQLQSAQDKLTPRLRPGAQGPLRSASLPPEAALADHVRRQRDLEQEASALRARARELDQRQAQSRERLRALELAGAPPTESELSAVRKEREVALAAFEQALTAASLDRHVLESAVAMLRKLVERSDELADRLRRESERVLERARLSAESEALQGERDRLGGERDEHAQRVTALEDQWQALFASSVLIPGAPLEMHALLVRASAELDAAERALRDAEAALSTAQRERRTLDERTQATLQRLALGPDTELGAALELVARRRKQLERLEQHDTRAAELERAERDERALEHEIEALLSAYTPELSARPKLEAAEALLRSYEATHHALGERARIERRAKERQLEADAHEAEAGSAERELAGLFASAGVQARDALLEAEQRSVSARKLEHELAEVEQRLRVRAQGGSLDALESEVAGMSADEIRPRLVELDEEIERLNEEHAQASREIGGLESGLRMLEQDRGAADSALEAEQALAELRARAQAYLRTRLAHGLLDRVVRRYREHSKEPLIARASELFGELTLGHHPGLVVDYEHGEQPVLMCANADGQPLHVAAMSEGTRDQLYLALRLSAVLHFVEQKGPIPLVLDDVLSQFDEDRTRAALRVLAQIAEHTQVLFFTHHARHVELAREVLTQDQLELHELERPPRQGTLELGHG